MKFWIEVEEAQPVPKMYGLAWTLPWKSGSICCPVPFNIIAAYSRHIWLWLSFFATAKLSNPIDRAEISGYIRATTERHSK